jgi:predicted HTH transcriptional regulator
MNLENISLKLNELLSLPHETEWVEFKVNNDSELGEYISALANSACLHGKEHGYLVFGVEDKTHRIVGTTFKPKQEKYGNEELENWLLHSLDPRIDFRVFELEYEQKPIAVFEVDAVKDRPVKFKGEAYIRVGSYKKKLSGYPEKERQIWLKSNQVDFENDTALSQADAEKLANLLDTSKYFERMGLSIPSDFNQAVEKLVQEKLLAKTGTNYNIMNLCALLFARNLRDFPTISRKTVRVIIYDGKNKLKPKLEREFTSGYAVVFEDIISFVESHLPMNEVIKEALRTEVKMYPSIAIRELIANAVIHQDFTIRGAGVMVEVYENRIEISNPGKPLIDTLRFIDHSPISRNEKLASIMRRMNMCEERGSGIDKVIDACELHQLPAPQFVADSDSTRVSLYGTQSLTHMDKQDKIRACYQHCVLKYVMGEQMTNQSLRKRLGISDANYPLASKIISDTFDAKLIKDYDPSNQSKKFSKYVPYWA